MKGTKGERWLKLIQTQIHNRVEWSIQHSYVWTDTKIIEAKTDSLEYSAVREEEI